MAKLNVAPMDIGAVKVINPEPGGHMHQWEWSSVEIKQAGKIMFCGGTMAEVDYFYSLADGAWKMTGSHIRKADLWKRFRV